MKSVIFIAGPTSSGKSKVAAHLAREINGEVISCDSMQVYKDMDILAAAPQKSVLAKSRHHLIKVIPPEEEYNVARFIEESSKLIESILSRGKVPIFAGGTGLYMKSLIDGIFSSPPKDEALRSSLIEAASREGKDYLYEKLRKIDPETAKKLHPNDTRRIVRALEVYELTGKTIQEKKMASRGISSKYDIKIFALSLPRELLYSRINSTVEKMFEEGLVEEVKLLKGRRLSLTAGKALGIKEVSSFLDGALSLEEAKEELKKNTRNYAKRQLTWFRQDRRIKWIDADKAVEEVTRDILRELNDN